MALYHTYRPQTFADILGQEHVTKTLREQIKKNNYAHAYLFTGPRGVGKTSTARIIAKAINAGVTETGEVKDNDIAKAITEKSHIDIIEIDAASHTGVDNVREQIIENAQFRPTSLDKKVFIIDEVHMLSTSAFNALLKILEEPPEYVLFILATTEPHKLPATIISRCQRFDFAPIPHSILSEHLKTIASDHKVTVDTDVLDTIVHKSGGCARDAVGLLDQIMSMGKTNISAKDIQMILPVSNTETVESFITALLKKDHITALEQIQSIISNGENIKQFALDCCSYLRYSMIAKTGTDIKEIATDLSPSSLQNIKKIIESISYQEIINLLEAMLKRTQEIPYAPIPQLPLEILVVSWCTQNNDQILEKTTPKDTATPVSTPSQPQAKITENAPKIEKTTQTNGAKNNTAAAVWNSIITTVEAQSPSLVFILKMATVGIEEKKNVNIHVQYSFHKEKLLTANAKKLIESAIETCTGTKKSITILVAEKEQKKATAADQDNNLQDLATAFGGTVIS